MFNVVLHPFFNWLHKPWDSNLFFVFVFWRDETNKICENEHHCKLGHELSSVNQLYEHIDTHSRPSSKHKKFFQVLRHSNSVLIKHVWLCLEGELI